MVVVKPDADAAVAPVAEVSNLVGIKPPETPFAAAIAPRRFAHETHESFVEIRVEFSPSDCGGAKMPVTLLSCGDHGGS